MLQDSKGTRWYRFWRWVLRHIIYRALGGVTIKGAEKVPMEGPVIFAPVHFSFLDPPLVGSCTKRAISFMAKKELFDPPVFGPFIRTLGAFPVDRGSGDVEAIRLALKLLSEGKALLMFPEGTRGQGETLGPITPGIGMLAKKSGARIVPVGINGTHRVLPKGQGKPKRGHMTVHFGDPITYEEFAEGLPDKQVRVVFAEALEARLVKLCHDAGLPIRAAAKAPALDTTVAPAPSRAPAPLETE